jgi:hypothetical protein
MIQDAVAAARPVQAKEDLSSIRIGAHDEIFQSHCPTLARIIHKKGSFLGQAIALL